ncbi:MAG: DUF935 family protein [Ignavibacteriaceae bacterium]
MKANKNTKLFSEFASREQLELLNRMMRVLPDPDQILQENGYDFSIYRDLLTDAHLMATVQQRKMQIIQMNWEVEYELDNEIKDKAEKILNNLPLQNIISEILDCIFFGMTIQEVEWKQIEDQIIPVNVVAKPQEWFIFTLDNDLVMRKKTNGTYLFEEGEKLPDLKFIVNRYYPTYINPYGEKILSRCYWPITFKRAAIEFWQLMVERFGMPFLTGYYPTGYTPAQVDDFVELLKDMITENVAAFDEVHKDNINLLETPSYDIGQLYEFLVKHHNKEISKAVLTVTLTTDVSEVGSYKAGEIHRDMLSYIGTADKRIVEESLNRLLQFWTFLNYGTIEAPTIKLRKKDTIVEESSDRDERLSKMGVVFTREYYKKRYNLEEEDFELVEEENGSSKEKGGLILVPSKKNPAVKRWQKADEKQKEMNVV